MKSSHRIVHSDWNCEDESACLSLLSESAFLNPAVVLPFFHGICFKNLQNMFCSWYMCTWMLVHTCTLVGQTACDTVLSLEFGESVLLSNTWLIDMKAGCRAVQTRHSWITPRWEATNTGLLTTILRRQVKQLQLLLCRWMWLLFGHTLYSFLCFI